MRTRLGVLIGVIALVVVACGGDDDTDTTGADTTGADTTGGDTTGGDTTSVEGSATTGAEAAGLAGICPDPLVIQLDWEPESEHGGLYELVGDGYEIDTEFKRVRGPLVASG